MKRLVIVIIVMAISQFSIATESPTSKACTWLTWPDGHGSQIGTFDETVAFLTACEQASGTCKLGGKPFNPDASSSAAGQPVVQALVECMLGPAVQSNQSGVQEPFRYFRGDKTDEKLKALTADLDKSPPLFAAQATSKLSAERLKAMDIEFFNQFWFKNEGPNEERAPKIHALAEEGFEVAHLAEMLFDFGKLGIPTFRKDYLPYWKRLKDLAKSGNASAQCLFAQVPADYRQYKLDPPTIYDEKVLAPNYLRAAALQGQYYCLTTWASEAYRNDQATYEKVVLRCAETGYSHCQEWMAIDYFTGTNVAKDLVKGMCWIVKAKTLNRTPSLEDTYRSHIFEIQEKIGSDGFSRLLNKLDRDTDCNTVTAE